MQMPVSSQHFPLNSYLTFYLKIENHALVLALCLVLLWQDTSNP